MNIQREKIKKIIKKVLEKIIQDYQPTKIILFGSYAYGHPSSTSDIDLLIIKDSHQRRIDRFCEVRRIIRDIKGISIQPLVFTKKELRERLKIGDEFIKEIWRRGQILYG